MFKLSGFNIYALATEGGGWEMQVVLKLAISLSVPYCGLLRHNAQRQLSSSQRSDLHVVLLILSP